MTEQFTSTSHADAAHEPCEFCLLPQTKTTEVFKEIHGDLPHTLDLPDVPEGFTVLQNLIPIADEGAHLVVIPNSHFISLATVEDQEGVAATTDLVTNTLQQVFPNKPIFTFEHGPGFIQGEPIACGGCHLDHAHGHMASLPEGTELGTIRSATERILRRSGWENLEDHTAETNVVFSRIEQVSGIQPYLQIGMIKPDGETTAVTYTQKSRDWGVPSQLMQAVVATEVYKQPDPTFWHWRDISMGLTSPERRQQIQGDVVSFRRKLQPPGKAN